MSANHRAVSDRRVAIPPLVEGDRPPDGLMGAWPRAGFVVVGLIPTLWVMRRMPIGFFHMLGFWTAFTCAVLLVVAFIGRARQPRLGKLIPPLAAGIPLGLVLLAMVGVSKADARGDHLPITDTQLRVATVAVQAALALWLARRTRQSGHRVVELVIGYTAVLATMTVRLTVGQHWSAWWFVPAVALVSVQIATLPKRNDAPAESATEAPNLVRTASAFVGIVAVFALQAQIMNRPSGLVALIVAFAVGLFLLLIRSRPRPQIGGAAVLTAAGLFIPVLFAIVLLMPSLAGAKYLLDIGFHQEPVGLRFDGSQPIPGGYQRWYGTELDEPAALAAVTNALKSPPVSVTPDPDGHGVTGLLFGYRIESRYNPSPTPCRTPKCVLITVRRATA